MMNKKNITHGLPFSQKLRNFTHYLSITAHGNKYTAGMEQVLP